MRREDVLKVDALKTELSSAFRTFERSMTKVFGELVYAVDTVVDRYNDLETRHTTLERRHEQLETRIARLEHRGNGGGEGQ